MRIPCPQCKIMVNKRTLKSHLNTHAPDDKRFRCDLCGKLYSTNGGLKWHMTLKHAEDDEKFELELNLIIIFGYDTCQ